MSEWKKVKIGEIFKIEKGSLQSSKCIPGKYDFITAATDWKTHESYSHDCEAIVYAVAASGSLGRAHYVKGKFIASDLCFILTEKNKEKYPINFLFYQLVFEVLRDEIVSKTKTGTSKESINQKNFSNYEIPYIPYDYQMNNYKKLVDTKKTVIKILKEIESQKAYAKQLRQNILQEAIEGKLTEEWRKENPVVKGNPDFDAEALFEKIQEEKCHTDSELLRNSKKKVFESISEIEQPFEIPEGWKWVRLGEICKFLSRGKSPKYSQLKKYPVFAQKCNLKNGGISLEQSQFLDPNILPKWKEEYKLLNGDVLVNSTGTGTVMRACFFTNDCLGNYPFVVPDSHISVIRSVDTIEAKYIYYCCIGDTVQNYWEDNLAGSTNQKELYIGVVGNTLIPLPPLAEQKEIVSRVEKLLENVTELEKQITEREEMTKQLMQSIMKDAFREV